MTTRQRMLIVLMVIVTVILLANGDAIAAWLDRQGLFAWAGAIRAEYLTGTAITVIVVMFFLLDRSPVFPPNQVPICRCPVCGEATTRAGRYCAACGSRVA